MMEYADLAADIVVRFDDAPTTGLNFKGIEIVLARANRLQGFENGKDKWSGRENSSLRPPGAE